MYVIGLPMGKLGNSDSFFNILGWVSRRNDIELTPKISNRIDYNRNYIINVAKERKAVLIMIDSDVAPITPFDEAMKYAYEDFSKGYDVVFAPVRDASTILFAPKNENNYASDKPYEVWYSSFSLVIFSQKLIEEIKPVTIEELFNIILSDENIDKRVILDENKVLSNATMHEKSPVYTLYTNSRSEDTFLCKKLFLDGYKLCVDPRIRVYHKKPIDIEFTPEDGKLFLETKRMQEAKTKNQKKKN